MSSERLYEYMEPQSRKPLLDLDLSYTLDKVLQDHQLQYMVG